MKNRTQSRIPIVSVVVLVLLTLVILGWDLHESRERSLHNAETRAAARASANRQNILGMMHQVDMVLQELRRDIDFETGKAGLDGLTAETVKRMGVQIREVMAEVPSIMTIQIANADGRYVLSSVDPVPNLNIAERKYFRSQANADEDRLVISEPLFARSSNRWAMFFSRRIVDSEGRFAGVLLATVDVRTLSKMLRPVDNDDRWIFAIYDRECRLVARLPEQMEQIGQIAPDEKLEEAIAHGGAMSYRGEGFGAREKFCWAFDVPDNYPLVFVAGHSISYALNNWRILLWISLVCGALLVGNVWVIINLTRSQRDADIAYQTLFDNAQDAIIVLDERLHVIDANRMTSQKLGHPIDKVLGMRMDAILVPTSQLHLGETLDKLGREGQVVFTGEYRRADGSMIPVEVSASRILFRGTSSFLTTARDVTLRVEVEKELASSEERQRLLVERFRFAMASMSLGTWDWDVVTNDLEWDSGMMAIYGIVAGEFSSTYEGWASRIFPEDRPATEKALQVALAGGLPYDALFRIRLGDGSIRFIRGTALVKRDSRGHPLRMIGLNWDVTEHHKAEQTLVAAKEAAELATKAKADFLAVMSHEIRTPLNGVLGLANMLMDTNLSDSQRELLEELHTCGDGLLVLINDILDFSKIEAGKLELEDNEFDLLDAVDDAMTLVAERVNAKGLTLMTETAADVPFRVRGDQTRVRQVLSNLLSNAVKFTERGTIRIDIQRAGSDRPGLTKLAFSVIDTGIGMPADVQRRLFQAFTQAEASISRRFGGTGLGLSICRRLVECMGGEISVESEAGRGSTFRFTIEVPDCPVGEDQSLAGLRTVLHIRSASLRTSLVEQLTRWGVDPNMISGDMLVSTLDAARAGGQAVQVLLTDAHLMQGEEIRKAVSSPPVCKVIDLSGDRDAMADVSMSRPLKLGGLRRHLLDIKHGTDSFHRARAEHRKLSGHILVAEDNPVNQRIVINFLTKLGLSYDLASNGQEVLTAMSRRHYDLVLMDCHMPVMDGIRASRKIRERESQREGGKRIPIVALTAGATMAERAAADDAGMDSFVVKPIRVDELEAVLSRWLPLADCSQDIAEDVPLVEVSALQRLHEYAGDCGEFLRLFNVDSRQCVSDMVSQLRAGESMQLAETAHRVKGAALLIGARRLAVQIMIVEERSKTGNVDACHAIVDGLPALFELTVQALKTEIEKIDAG